MKPIFAPNRRLTCCLLLSAVLVLGIVQWSFLPVLIQNGLFLGRPTVEVSPGHSSKFAAHSKFLLGNFLEPFLKQANPAELPAVVSHFFQLEEPCFTRDDRFFSHRQLRAPPSI